MFQTDDNLRVKNHAKEQKKKVPTAKPAPSSFYLFKPVPLLLCLNKPKTRAWLRFICLNKTNARARLRIFAQLQLAVCHYAMKIVLFLLVSLAVLNQLGADRKEIRLQHLFLVFIFYILFAFFFRVFYVTPSVALKNCDDHTLQT